MPRKHLSVRLEQNVFEQLDTESKRSGQTRSQLAKRLLDEGLRMEKHPEIHFRPGPVGRRPALIDGPDIWEVVRIFIGLDERDETRIQRTAEIGNLDDSQVRTALRYYSDFHEEIDEWIQRGEAESVLAEDAWFREQELLRS